MIGAPAAASLVAGAGQAPQSQNLAALVTSLMGGGSLGTYQKNNRAYPPDVQTALGDLRLAQKQQSPGYGSIDGATWGNVVAALLQPMAGRKKEKKAREGMAEAAKAQAAAADKSDQTKRARDFADHVRQTNYDRATAPEQAADTPEKIRLFEYAQKLAETDPDAAQKFLEYYGGKGGGVTINTGEKGPQYGSIPQGYMVQDGQMLPVPGSPADMEMQEAAGKADAREESRASKADNVVDEIDHAMDLLGTGTAGIPGALTRRIPGTDAVDFEAAMKTVLGNVGFDRLQKMREESPTGGALGQVSNLELGLVT